MKYVKHYVIGVKSSKLRQERGRPTAWETCKTSRFQINLMYKFPNFVNTLVCCWKEQ